MNTGKIEEKHQAFFENSADAIIITTPAGDILEMNQATLDMFGYSRAELVHMRAEDFYVDPADRAVFQQAIESAGQVREFELRLCNRAGEQLDCLFTAIARRNEAGEIVAYQGIIRDVTEQKRLERQSHQSLERRSRQVQVGAEITQEIASAAPLREIFERIVRLIQERFDYYFVQLYTLTESGLLFQAGAGNGPAKGDSLLALEDEQSLIAQAARQQEPVLVSDTGQESVAPDVRSELAVPIRLKSELLGVLDVQSDRVGGLDVEDQLWLVGLCGQLAIAINNHRVEAERSEAEESLRKLSRAVDQSANLIVITNLDGSIEYVNAKFTEVTGYTAAEAIGQNPRILKSDTMPTHLYRELWQTIKAGQEWQGEFLNKKKNGSHYWASASISPIKNIAGEITHFLAVQEDITKRKQAEAELQRQNAYLTALHETALGLISRLDLTDLLETLIIRAGQLFHTSHGAIYLVEPGSQEIECKVGVGAYSRLIGQRTKRSEGVAGRVWQTGQPVVENDENYPIRDGKEAQPIGAIVGVPLTGHPGSKQTEPIAVIGVLSLAHDADSNQTFVEEEVTLLNRFAQLASIALDNARLFEEVQTAKERAEAANRAKSAFLANVTHELRTPLNAVIGYSEILQEEAQELARSEFVADLNRIHMAGKHLLALINDILDFSKIEAGKMTMELKTFDVGSLVRDIAHIIQPKTARKKNELVLQLDDDLGAMYADPAKVRQILYNLLDNAAKFTEQGRITLAVNREKTAEKGKDWIIFTVSDTGIGMSQDQMDRIFLDFVQVDASFTRKYGGTGLGLAITRRLCQMMKGDIDVQSELGRGSTFTIRLPGQIACGSVKPLFVDESSELETRIIEPDNRDKIVVIDDDPVVRDLLQRMLVKEGFYVKTAANGPEGLRLIRQLKPLAIVLDVVMAGMDGWEVLSTLKADSELADIPVVVLTMVDDKSRAYALGASAYLTKPIERSWLMSTLQSYQDNQ